VNVAQVVPDTRVIEFKHSGRDRSMTQLQSEWVGGSLIENKLSSRDNSMTYLQGGWAGGSLRTSTRTGPEHVLPAECLLT